MSNPYPKPPKYPTPQSLPGRLHTLSADQEIKFKQTWAYLLKYYGYPIDFPDEDVQYKECFVASTITQMYDNENGMASTALGRSNTRNSVNSSNSRSTVGSKKLKLGGMFGKKKEVEEKAAPVESARLRKIQTQSSMERYNQVTQPDPKIMAIYSNYYKQTFEHSRWYDDSLDDDTYDDGDNLSLERFVTASTSLTDYGEVYPTGSKAGNGNGNGHGYNGNGNGYNGNNGYSNSGSSTSVHHKNLFPLFSEYDPKTLHKTTFNCVSVDHIDNLLLRFVRARKWDIEKAIGMMSKTLQWRATEYPAYDWTLEGDSTSYVNGSCPGLTKNFTTSKCYLRGTDKEGHPIFIFKAKKHLIGDSPLADTQRFAVLTIEWTKLLLQENIDGVDQCTVFFDLSGFSLKNADYGAIKFLAEIFEAHYPETLGFILIHNAPWIFSTVWNIVKNWLDPVVASKIRFTKDYKDLTKFIEPHYIPDYLGGQDNFNAPYPIPTEKHTVPPRRPDGEFARLMKERDDLFVQFIETTQRWVESVNPEVSSKYLQDKMKLGTDLIWNYRQLDKYIRNPGMYDRNGTLIMEIPRNY
ncbi:uncharacterized protein KQ657_004791 [Scheffersomyces spartinae]|uniref:CRAL-TRIO domain-containing protein n=1 Tax=Scheffersomyces spartinae TaxID=45513 RepID=A0A9P8AI70_9ASCO|nr:uncharacterized protein KQ657_004791 [Scheffersomyces spartinae]KAG7194083.1 hypothetical protein KQ657_004791 [Scheffersomyces spartinae]